ncbi:hypothetical protein FIBSPDRAFT_970637 [Athelia psychrophila]|uniref:Uncharacterized protein n=1 Tax=Athelia psychrophila TaxID=1759441 RepID=A0A167SL22_9AGAM|nr:hypothetical protein FIBSPDRAFT_970637 [Fibularhizoctonia sp. CBS 109695]
MLGTGARAQSAEKKEARAGKDARARPRTSSFAHPVPFAPASHSSRSSACQGFEFELGRPMPRVGLRRPFGTVISALRFGTAGTRCIDTPRPRYRSARAARAEARHEPAERVRVRERRAVDPEGGERLEHAHQGRACIRAQRGPLEIAQRGRSMFMAWVSSKCEVGSVRQDGADDDLLAVDAMWTGRRKAGRSGRREG